MNASTESHPSREAVALIGTGVMGASMARRLLAAGFRVTVANRTAERARPLVDAGAAWAASPAEAATAADAVITIVGTPDDVRSVYLGADGRPGILDAAPRGALLVDMTTSRPSLAREIHAAAAARGLDALDAPVSGGDVGARDGTLSIMVGGDEGALERARPVLAVLGRTIVRQGPAGAGQHAKLANQVAIAGTMLGAMEALLYVRRAGLDPTTVLASIGAGAAGSWTLSNLYPRAVAGDLAPGFAVRHLVKDLRIARDEAASNGLSLPGLALALGLYERLAADGGADLGTQALIRVLDDVATRA